MFLESGSIASFLQEACRVLGFRGNIGGAWRAFDEDLSGRISQRITLGLGAIFGDFLEISKNELGFMDVHLQTCI